MTIDNENAVQPRTKSKVLGRRKRVLLTDKRAVVSAASRNGCYCVLKRRLQLPLIVISSIQAVPPDSRGSCVRIMVNTIVGVRIYSNIWSDATGGALLYIL